MNTEVIDQDYLSDLHRQQKIVFGLSDGIERTVEVLTSMEHLALVLENSGEISDGERKLLNAVDQATSAGSAYTTQDAFPSMSAVSSNESAMDFARNLRDDIEKFFKSIVEWVLKVSRAFVDWTRKLLGLNKKAQKEREVVVQQIREEKKKGNTTNAKTTNAQKTSSKSTGGTTTPNVDVQDTWTPPTEIELKQSARYLFTGNGSNNGYLSNVAEVIASMDNEYAAAQDILVEFVEYLEGVSRLVQESMEGYDFGDPMASMRFFSSEYVSRGLKISVSEDTNHLFDGYVLNVRDFEPGAKDTDLAFIDKIRNVRLSYDKQNRPQNANRGITFEAPSLDQTEDMLKQFTDRENAVLQKFGQVNQNLDGLLSDLKHSSEKFMTRMKKHGIKPGSDDYFLYRTFFNFYPALSTWQTKSVGGVQQRWAQLSVFVTAMGQEIFQQIKKP